MKTEDQLQQLLQEAEIKTPPVVDEMILERATQCLGHDSRSLQRPVWKAIAAVLLVCLGLVTWQIVKTGPQELSNGNGGGLVPTQILSMGSLRQAYLRGDTEALEAHLDRAFDQVGPRPTARLEQEIAELSQS